MENSCPIREESTELGRVLSPPPPSGGAGFMAVEKAVGEPMEDSERSVVSLCSKSPLLRRSCDAIAKVCT